MPRRGVRIHPPLPVHSETLPPHRPSLRPRPHSLLRFPRPPRRGRGLRQNRRPQLRPLPLRRARAQRILRQAPPRDAAIVLPLARRRRPRHRRPVPRRPHPHPHAEAPPARHYEVRPPPPSPPRPAHTFADLTAYVATELLFATGMRVAELASLLDAAVDVEDGTITIVGKGNRQRRVFVPDELKSLLRDYRTARDRCASTAGTFLINSRGDAASPQMIRRLVRLHGERSAVRDRVTPHMFRHSVATYLLEEGVDIRYVQRLLGHRSISTTEIYTHVADAALKLRITERHPRRGIVLRQETPSR
ncbi:MAG: tyrosine-type recombinase/integrase [Acidobacteriota bacterium]